MAEQANKKSLRSVPLKQFNQKLKNLNCEQLLPKSVKCCVQKLVLTGDEEFDAYSLAAAHLDQYPENINLNKANIGIWRKYILVAQQLTKKNKNSFSRPRYENQHTTTNHTPSRNAWAQQHGYVKSLSASESGESEDTWAETINFTNTNVRPPCQDSQRGRLPRGRTGYSATATITRDSISMNNQSSRREVRTFTGEQNSTTNCPQEICQEADTSFNGDWPSLGEEWG